MVDYLGKYAYFIPLKHRFTTQSGADKFSKEVMKHHGLLNSICVGQQ